MKKMTKVLTVVLGLSLLSIFPASAAEIKNPTFGKVRKNLWYLGINGPSLDEVESQIKQESTDSNKALRMPEELSKALEKLKPSN